eukprot:TRINITY_DN2961_c0_g1_i1.p1 TRINITY_DN2961_c0_g1~~TRINITY_DN2961_c0_g1_i1.p1  ORF type:complete len:978 (+),score=374.96 TRINITY_DN2961_c0_g1_i1:116-2935(+)
MDGGGSNRRKRKDKWEDPLNPHDRKRNGVWPVGLKNVGQTCWFSAVIQSLFYLPAFRSLVLNFSLPSGRTPEDKKTKKVLEFMEELRKLFALLVASRRKYVDPVRSVEILKGSIGSSSMDNNQQDVSEFTHKVLEWAELAFKLAAEERPSSQEEEDSMEEAGSKEGIPKNPMANLFYGEVLTEGKNRGVSFSHTESIGQWNLHVHNFKDIHESLENSTALEYFDNDSLGGQERWFSRLQPVLFFELSRFQFNQERKLAEKIHNKLEFPQRIFMDRYMDVNKRITRHKREQTRILKEKRDLLSSRLNKFTAYGSSDWQGNQQIPLTSVLQHAMDFANSCSSSIMQVDSVEEGSYPKMMTPAGSLANITEGDTHMEVEATKDDEQEEEKQANNKHDNDCDNKNVPDFCPTPKYVSDAELQTIQNCFLRWKAEVEVDVSSLECSRKELETQIQEMYNEESLRKMEYRLHAVMVHEGYVDSGHYWAYVYDHKRKTWLKFNDNSVNETTWPELFKESVGGHSNTSAYSLVYVDASLPELFDSEEQMEEEGSPRVSEDDPESLLLCLPNDLREFVLSDNRALDKEIQEWDERAASAKKKDPSTFPSTSGSIPPEQKGGEGDAHYAQSHAALVYQLSYNLMRSSSEQNNSVDPFRNLLELTLATYNEKVESGSEESRLESFPLYCLANGVPQNTLQLALIEQYAHLPPSECASGLARAIKSFAEQALAIYERNYPTESGLLQEWHRAYHLYRLSVYWFIRGLEDWLANRFDESLQFFSIASYITVNLNRTTPIGPKKALELEPLMHYLRTSLSEVNYGLIKEFKLGERLDSVISSLQRIVPVMNFIQTRISGGGSCLEKDTQCLEDVRSRWCSLLGENYIVDEHSTLLSDAIRIVLEPPPELCPRVPRVLENLSEDISPKNNLELREQYRRILHLSSELKASASTN